VVNQGVRFDGFRMGSPPWIARMVFLYVCRQIGMNLYAAPARPDNLITLITIEGKCL
jgi:hypothetical protein